jgi:hypothetical protein
MLATTVAIDGRLERRSFIGHASVRAEIAENLGASPLIFGLRRARGYVQVKGTNCAFYRFGKVTRTQISGDPFALHLKMPVQRQDDQPDLLPVKEARGAVVSSPRAGSLGAIMSNVASKI